MCENSCYGFSEFFSVSDLPPILQREGRDGVRGGRLEVVCHHLAQASFDKMIQ